MVTDLKIVNAIDRINEIIPKCRSFKIGKSGEKLSDRLKQPDYNGYYTNIEKVYVGTKEEVDEVEAFLIDRYINHPKATTRKMEMQAIMIQWQKMLMSFLFILSIIITKIYLYVNKY